MRTVSCEIWPTRRRHFGRPGMPKPGVVRVGRAKGGWDKCELAASCAARWWWWSLMIGGDGGGGVVVVVVVVVVMMMMIARMVAWWCLRL